MAVSLAAGFKVNNNEPIDSRLVLTKAQMKSIQAAGMPAHYFALCSEDNKIYVYDSSNTEDETTGKFRLSSGGATVDDVTIKVKDEKLTVDTVNPVAWKTVENHSDLITVIHRKASDSSYTIPENTNKIILKTKDNSYKLVINNTQNIDYTNPSPNIEENIGFTVCISPYGSSTSFGFYDKNNHEVLNFDTQDNKIIKICEAYEGSDFKDTLEYQFYTKEENKTITIDDELNSLQEKLEVNPTQWATSTLSTVKIGDVVYELDDGTGSTLYESADAWTTVNNDNLTIGWSTSAKSTWHTLTAFNEEWKDVSVPPSAEDDKQYVYKNNAWVALPELSNTVITAVNQETGKTEYQSVVSLTLDADGLLNFNNGKLIGD